MARYDSNIPTTKVVGNDYRSDADYGFKQEVAHAFESYAARNVNLSTDFGKIIESPTMRAEFLDNVLESLTNSPAFTSAECANSPFYNNYTDRLRALEDNSMDRVAVESAILGYAPIVAYNPFFLKKQWISTIFKDVLMTEIPPSPVINYAVEKRYLKSLDGTEYPIPDVFYDDSIMRDLIGQSTGNAIKSDFIEIASLKGLDLIDPTYIPGVIKDDPAVELTQDIRIAKVKMSKQNGETVEVPVNIKTDITTHNFVKGDIKYDVVDPSSGDVTETIEDKLIGEVDFVKGSITVISVMGKVTAVSLAGRIANRWNDRSLDTVRRVEQIQFVMPESGPRLNSSITVEDAADALVLQKIDVIADNVDVMGRTLAELEDFEIRDFLNASFDAQKNAGSMAVSFLNENSLIVEGAFDALPYETYTHNISDWMKDAREYFERVLAGLKMKLKSPDVIVVCVAHPNVIRFLQNGINWVFTDDTTISGTKISYQFGIYTSAQDRVHVLTSMYMKEDDGLRFVVIPLTKELITFKHFKYNTVIDRNYRNPLHPLTPNIMVTHRTLTAEILPVQGKMTISGREMISPTTLKRNP